MDNLDEMDDLDKTDESETMNTAYSASSLQTYQPRTKLKLSEVERLIRKHRIIVPCPARQTLVNMCEDGTFSTVGEKPTSFGWLVFEESFWNWARNLDGVPVAP